MAQNDALPPQGTVDASGWLHNMRGDAMSMPGFGHLSDSVIVHTGASAYSAHQNGGNSAPQASTPHAAMAATCPDPTYREIVRCPAPSHFLRPRADVHAHVEANNMESEIDKHAHDDMKKRPNKRSKNQQWQTVSIVTGWSAVNNALQLLANKDFPGGEWKPCRAHETKEFVDYHYMCPFGRMGHTCPVTCRVRIPRTSKGDKGEMKVPVDDRPIVHKTSANIEVQVVHGQTHEAHTGAQGQHAAHKGAHLLWKQATQVNGFMLDWGSFQIEKWLHGHKIACNKEDVYRCMRFNWRTKERNLLKVIGSRKHDIPVSGMGCFREIVRCASMAERMKEREFDRDTVYIVPGSYIDTPPDMDVVPTSLRDVCLVFTSFNLSLNVARVHQWFGAASPGPVAMLDHTYKVW